MSPTQFHCGTREVRFYARETKITENGLAAMVNEYIKLGYIKHGRKPCTYNLVSVAHVPPSNLRVQFRASGDEQDPEKCHVTAYGL